jgi:hypothetical protein
VSPPLKLLDRVREAIRTRHYSRRTEEAYVYWIRRYIVFHGKAHPSTQGAPEISAFLTWLAVQQQVSASTQNQALSALLFLYRRVLGMELGAIEQIPRARMPVRVPVVLSRDEVSRILKQVTGKIWMIVVLLYGAGLRIWWERRHRFELCVSAAVVDEAQRGDSAVVKRRMALLNGIPVLDLDADVHRLADRLLSEHAVPPKALVDAVHIAAAAVNAINYLLTWNCRHIANAAVRGKIERACRAEGLNAPVICTPEELMET